MEKLREKYLRDTYVTNTKNGKFDGFGYLSKGNFVFYIYNHKCQMCFLATVRYFKGHWITKTYDYWFENIKLSSKDRNKPIVESKYQYIVDKYLTKAEKYISLCTPKNYGLLNEKGKKFIKEVFLSLKRLEIPYEMIEHILSFLRILHLVGSFKYYY